MRFDLTQPCKHCPFRRDETRITFASRERAEEIEEQAYRHGFPCHVSAECVDDPLNDQESFVFGNDTQHCAGYVLLQLHEDAGAGWPAIGNDEELAAELAGKMDWTAPVFESVSEFLNANTPADEEQE